MLPGTSLKDALALLLAHPATTGIALLGEIGGEAEMEAAEFLGRWRGAFKPVVGMVTGRTAPKGRTMGHAGAVATAGGDASGAEDKIRALQGAGVQMLTHPGEVGGALRRLLGVDGGAPKMMMNEEKTFVAAL